MSVANPLPVSALVRLSDEQLVVAVQRLAACERRVTAELIAHLAEFDTRRLYLPRGYPSLFVYCTGALALSEHGAYNRIEAARLARRFPVVLELFRSGSVTLATVRRLAPHLTPQNHRELLDAASRKSRREVEELIASRFPLPAVPSTIRKLPSRLLPVGEPEDAPAASPAEAANVGGPPLDPADEHRPVGPNAALPALSADPLRSSPAVMQPSTPAIARLQPLATDRYKVTFTATAASYQRLRRAQDLLRHRIPSGDLAEIFDLAIQALVDRLEKRKLATTGRPRRTARRQQAAQAATRHIPADVRREVWRRDGGRCAFVSADGHRCGERGLLEFHHARPYAASGQASVTNIQLRCRPHNGHEARLYFGPIRALEERGIEERGSARAPTRPGASRGG